MSYYFSKQPAWTKAETLEAAEYLLAGWTAAEIGMRMGVMPDAVRRRVAADAKLNAIGFDRKAMAARQIRAKSLKFSEIVVAKPRDLKAVHEQFDQQSHHLPLDDLASGECVWPVNEPERGGTHLFCGHVQAHGSRYCRHHFERSLPRLHCDVAEAA